jgi:hypothetical protein
MRRLLAVTLGCAALAAVPAVAHGAANPNGTGQPSQECGSAGATSAPAGFATGGFANAENHYANGTGHNVSQYDVACFQVTSAGH